MQEYVFVVMTNAAPGRDDEFNDWYSNVHVHDVVKVPGIVAARRYVLNDVQRRELPPNQPRYLALYDIQTDDLRKTLGVLAARAGTPEMPTSDALVRHSGVVYAPLGPIVRQRP
jgi:hypothetical protein